MVSAGSWPQVDGAMTHALTGGGPVGNASNYPL